MISSEKAIEATSKLRVNCGRLSQNYPNQFIWWILRYCKIVLLDTLQLHFHLYRFKVANRAAMCRIIENYLMEHASDCLGVNPSPISSCFYLLLWFQLKSTKIQSILAKFINWSYHFLESLFILNFTPFLDISVNQLLSLGGKSICLHTPPFICF
jgi:hypothetical protein